MLEGILGVSMKEGILSGSPLTLWGQADPLLAVLPPVGKAPAIHKSFWVTDCWLAEEQALKREAQPFLSLMPLSFSAVFQSALINLILTPSAAFGGVRWHKGRLQSQQITLWGRVGYDRLGSCR